MESMESKQPQKQFLASESHQRIPSKSSQNETQPQQLSSSDASACAADFSTRHTTDSYKLSPKKPRENEVNATSSNQHYRNTQKRQKKHDWSDDYSRRPNVPFEVSKLTRVARWLVLIWGIVLAAILVLSYPVLPETIPVHFGIMGTPNGWGSRAMVLLFALVILALTVFIFVLLGVNPRKFNYPVDVTEENAAQLYAESLRLCSWVGLCMQLIFTAIVCMVFSIPTTKWLVLLGVVLLFAGIINATIRMKRLA